MTDMLAGAEAALATDPLDRATWLILSDWYEENGSVVKPLDCRAVADFIAGARLTEVWEKSARSLLAPQCGAAGRTLEQKLLLFDLPVTTAEVGGVPRVAHRCYLWVDREPLDDGLRMCFLHADGAAPRVLASGYLLPDGAVDDVRLTSAATPGGVTAEEGALLEQTVVALLTDAVAAWKKENLK